MLWSYDSSPKYHLVEFFSGEAQVSQAFRDGGFRVASYDYLYDPNGMNFLSDGGFGHLVKSSAWQQPRLALLLAVRTAPLGLHVFAPDCSSWTRISRGTSQRNHVNMFGRMDLPWVRNGVAMISRFLGRSYGCGVSVSHNNE